MLARSVGLRALRKCACSARTPVTRPVVRRFSASAPTPSDATTATSHPLVGVTSQLDHVAPRFEIDPGQIDILDSPCAFYDTLKTKIRSAKRRIYLSTLYIGKTEQEFVEVIKEALENNPDLQVSILTDALRGTREDPEPSCASIIAPLITLYGERVKIAMFHTPNLNGWKKKYIPKRINEGWGLQHMKLYGFDDEIMLSGANLSNDYFTNRLDRYHVFASKELADYYAAVHDAVCEISYHLVPSSAHPGGFTLESPIHRGLPDPVWHSKRYKAYAKQLLEPLIHKKARQKMFPVTFTKDKTFVYPVAQFDALLGQAKNISFLDYEFAQYTSTEKPALTKIMKSLTEDAQLHGSRWTFSSGYFNPAPEMRQLLLAAAPDRPPSSVKESGSSDTCQIITASPWANGFYGSKGISGMLPAAYTLLARRFLRSVEQSRKGIELREWRKGTVGTPEGWTFHAKSLHITLAGDEDVGPSIAHVGSSNYGKRSLGSEDGEGLDLEVGAIIVTGDADLKARLRKEVDGLLEHTSRTTLDDLMRVERRVGFRVRCAMAMVELLGGAL